MKKVTTKNEQTIGDIAKSATSAVRQLVLKDPEKIVGIGKSDGGWIVTVEVLERRAVPDTQDLLSRYEIKLGAKGELIGLKQKMVRKRSDRLVLEDEEYKMKG